MLIVLSGRWYSRKRGKTCKKITKQKTHWCGPIGDSDSQKRQSFWNPDTSPPIPCSTHSPKVVYSSAYALIRTLYCKEQYKTLLKLTSTVKGSYGHASLKSLEVRISQVALAVMNPLPMRHKSRGFNLWVGIPCRRKWQPTPVFLPGESHGQGNLMGYSP